MEPKQEALSDTSEDIPILSSGEENDYELLHICEGNIVGNGPLKQLTLKDFNIVYGEDFMAENQEYVTDFLTELHQRQKEFEECSDEQEISDEEEISVQTFTSLNPNSEKTIE